MAYAPATSQPQLVCGNPNIRVWAYISDDAVVTVEANDYFTDGAELGVAAGDIILIAGANEGICLAAYA